MNVRFSINTVLLAVLIFLVATDIVFTVSGSSSQAGRGATFLQKQIDIEAQLGRLLSNLERDRNP